MRILQRLALKVTVEVSGKFVDEAGNYGNKEDFDTLSGVLICAI